MVFYIDLPLIFICTFIGYLVGALWTAKDNYEEGKVIGFLEGQMVLLKELNKGLPDDNEVSTPRREGRA